MFNSSVPSQSTQNNNNVNSLNCQEGTYSYTKQNITSLHKVLSPARLSTYIKLAESDTESALRLYKWNIELGQSLHMPFQTLEVALRNTISEALKQHFDKKWYDHAGFRTILDNKWAKPELEKAILSKKRKRHQVEAGDIISELNFGFWREMLKGRYESHIWRREQLISSFRYIPNDKNRQNIYNSIDTIVKLRNRISHHEPILCNKPRFIYEDALKVIGWICPDTKAWVKHHCEFDAIVQNCPSSIKSKFD